MENDVDQLAGDLSFQIVSQLTVSDLFFRLRKGRSG